MKNKIILGVSLFFRPFIKLFLHKLDSNIIHVTFIKLGGLNKFVTDLGGKNYIVMNNDFIILFINRIPFFIGSYNHLSRMLSGINCIYHVHQLSFNYLSDWEFLKDKKYIITIHDYFYICERFFMLDENFEFCNDDGRCCTDKDIRLYFMNKILLNAKYVIVPDESMLDYLQKYFPNVNFKVIPHGL